MGVFDTALAHGAAIGAQTRTSVTICQDYIDRIALKNSSVNAIVAQRPTYDILAEAALADARALAGMRLSALDGVPFTLKSCMATQGVLTKNTDGSINVASPLADGDIARKLKNAGCILLGKTNGPGGAIHTVTTFGETRNPRNLAYPTGGSSGGSAAAVAAGFSAFDVGSDSAGSIRIPASFCGVYGLKPTNGAVSGEGDWTGAMPSRPPFHTIDLYSYGPITRSIADLEAVLSIIAGPTPMRPAASYLRPSSGPTLWKLVSVPTIGVWNCSPFVQNAVDAMCSGLGEGVTVVSSPISFFNETAFNNIYAGLSTDPSAAAAGWPLNETPWHPSSLNYATLASRNAQAGVHALWLAQQVDALLGDADALVLGTTALSPPPIGGTDPASIAYMAMTALFCITGHPAVTIPLGTDPSTGVSFGVQLVGRHWRDLDLLAIAGQLTGLPGFQPPAL
jgi:amidase